MATFRNEQRLTVKPRKIGAPLFFVLRLVRPVSEHTRTRTRTQSRKAKNPELKAAPRDFIGDTCRAGMFQGHFQRFRAVGQVVASLSGSRGRIPTLAVNFVELAPCNDRRRFIASYLSKSHPDLRLFRSARRIVR